MKYEKKPISTLLRSPKTVFTFKDVALLWGETDVRAAISGVNYYVNTDQLYRIRRGLYAKDKRYNRDELATRINTPAYISFETVLGREGINFQYYSQIFVASYLNRELTIDGQTYQFRKIKNSILTNPTGILHVSETSIATPERALLDTLYLQKNFYFDHLDQIQWDLVFELLPLYTNARMERVVRKIHVHSQQEQWSL